MSRLNLDLPSSHLSFKPISLTFNGFNDIMAALHRESVAVATDENNVISLSDIAPFVPKLDDTDLDLDFSLDLRGNLSELQIKRFVLRDKDGGTLGLSLNGHAADIDRPDSLSYDLTNCSMIVNGEELASHLQAFIKPDVAKIIAKIPTTGLNMKAEGTTKAAVSTCAATARPEY